MKLREQYSLETNLLPILSPEDVEQKCWITLPTWKYVEWLEAKLSSQLANGKQLEPFSANDIDAAYLLGIFNTGGIDKLGSEIARLKELGKMPHEFIFLLKSA